MTPTKNEISCIHTTLQDAQHDHLLIQAAIKERFAAAIEALEDDDPKTGFFKTKIDQKPLNVLENECQKLFSNIVHLSERHTLATSIYHLFNPHETLDLTSTIINDNTRSLASLWPNTESRYTNHMTREKGSKPRQWRKEMKRLNESLLDLPVLINTIKQNKDENIQQQKTQYTEDLLADWYWALKYHVLSMQQTRKIFKGKDDDHVEQTKRDSAKDSIAFDISYSPKVIMKQPKIKSKSEGDTIVKQLQFSTRHSGHVIVVRIISGRNSSSQYSIHFDYHLPKSFCAFASFVSIILHQQLNKKQGIPDATTTGKLAPSSLPEFISTIIWPEMVEEFGIN
ncbi:6007_t:CDS:2 [Ambispora gerdemannii]|uniref:6007_t:CDS:1 n=1 Tax=Ambispora gerdemannii TaxID=144530 RepID=A0A9N9F685_9GLOM|nr:6007_t:CDS:2 [Ambispora gerdemannii]